MLKTEIKSQRENSSLLFLPLYCECLLHISQGKKRQENNKSAIAATFKKCFYSWIIHALQKHTALLKILRFYHSNFKKIRCLGSK